ncbi:MAG: hypothetical protein ACO2OX_01260 [Candidatus Nanopusillus sp.]
MDKRNLFILLIFIVLIFGIVYYLGNQNKTHSSGKILKLLIHNPTNCTVFSPFQQEIYINISIMKEYGINENGSNVFFFTDLNNITGSILYSWFAGYYDNYSIWWVRLPTQIFPYSNITIYMYIGPVGENYYEKYSPYVGISSYVYNNYNWGPLSIYDNGQLVFNFYGWFYDTRHNWVLNVKNGNYFPIPTINGIEMINYSLSQGSYIEPPNNGNIPNIPIIIEEGWYYNGEADANVISMYGEKSVVYAAGANKFGGYTPTLYGSIFVQYGYYNLQPAIYISYYGRTFPVQLYEGSFINKNQSYVYSYFLANFCNNTYVQAGYLALNNIPPISLLGTLENTNQTLKIRVDRNILSGRYFSISSGSGSQSTSSQSIYWVVGRTYPPDGIMPEIYIERLS